MLSDEQLWEKCKTNNSITCEDLGISSNLKGCCFQIEQGFQTFHSDGNNYFDSSGNQIRKEEILFC